MAQTQLSLSLIDTTSGVCDTARIAYGKDALDISFKRTVQIPQICPSDLPPDLGGFPMYHVRQYEDKLPSKIVSQGGLFLPIYQREALWISFKSKLPFAIEVLVDSINAISGYTSPTEGGMQHYIVSPIQDRLDGCIYNDGNVEQFVARPGNQGSVETPISGAGDTGFTTMELRVTPMKKRDMQLCFRSYERKIKLEVEEGDPITENGAVAIAFNTPEPSLFPGYPLRTYFEQTYGELVLQNYDTPQSMGLKSGETIELRTRTHERISIDRSRDRKGQVGRPRITRATSPDVDIATLPKRGNKINGAVFLDPLRPEDWDSDNSISFKVHLINAFKFKSTTGFSLPPTSIDPSTYKEYKYPWLTIYEEPMET